jgi:hypothetical protein
MAQIIKHRRGSLESVSSATKRAGELLVVTGSSGIDATNGDSILFIGVDGSTVTPANKILQGAVVPNLTGATYDTSIDGIPYYDTTNEKLFILNKGGNVEIKASAQTGGTGIVSASAQINITGSTGFTDYSSSVATSFSASNYNLTELSSSISSSNNGLATRVTGLEALTGSYATTGSNVFKGNQTISGSALVTDAIQGTGSIFLQPDVTDSRKLEIYNTSVDDVHIKSTGGLTFLGDDNTFVEVNASTQKIYLNAPEGVYVSGIEDGTIGEFSASVDSRFSSSLASITALSASVSSVTGEFSGSVATSFSASAAAQLVFSSSVATSFSASSAAQSVFSSSVASTNATQDGRISSLEAFSGSQETKDNAIGTFTASAAVSIESLNSYSASLKSALEVTGSNLTVLGNFEVRGTTTTINSTTVAIGDNVIELNGSAVTNGGLHVKDIEHEITASLIWDSVNDYWKAGVKDVESKVLLAGGDSVISGSAQINITGSTGFTDYSSSVATAISASVAASDWANINNKPAGIVSGSSQVISLLPTGVVSGSSQVVSNLVSQNIAVAGISGSTLNITGNAKIDGNVVIGGNITIGDANTDTISFSADLTSDILPATDNTYDLGSSSKKFAEVHATNLYGTINGSVNATNGVVSGSSQVASLLPSGVISGSAQILGGSGVVSGSSQITYADISSIPAGIVSGSSQITSLLPTGVISGSSQVVTSLLDQATDFGTGRLSADSIGNADGTSTITGSFAGDGSNLTGIASTLALSGSTGNDTLNLKTEALLVTGSNSISAAVTNNTITITAADATTSSKGVASFSDTNFGVTSGNVAIKAGGVNAATLNADVAGTGLSLDGVDNSLEVDFGSTAGTSVEGNTSLTVQGTANEIEISGGSITLGSGGTVTIGLPDDVIISGSLTANGNVYLGNSSTDSVTIAGNLFVNGTTTTIDSTTIQLGDNIIELNGSAAANGGLLVKDVTNPNTTSGSLLWDTTADYWKAGALGSEKELVRFSATPTSGSVQTIGANGLLVDSDISDDGVKVTIGTDLIISGLTASSFVVSNGSKKLISVTPSNAGDMIQWNGSSFVASNEIDGGTF